MSVKLQLIIQSVKQISAFSTKICMCGLNSFMTCWTRFLQLFSIDLCSDAQPCHHVNKNNFISFTNLVTHWLELFLKLMSKLKVGNNSFILVHSFLQIRNIFYVTLHIQSTAVNKTFWSWQTLFGLLLTRWHTFWSLSSFSPFSSFSL